MPEVKKMRQNTFKYSKSSLFYKKESLLTPKLQITANFDVFKKKNTFGSLLWLKFFFFQK